MVGEIIETKHGKILNLSLLVPRLDDHLFYFCVSISRVFLQFYREIMEPFLW